VVLQRDPDPVEVSRALRFLGETASESRTDPGSELKPWEQLAQVLLLTNEFMFID